MYPAVVVLRRGLDDEFKHNNKGLIFVRSDSDLTVGLALPARISDSKSGGSPGALSCFPPFSSLQRLDPERSAVAAGLL